jgi:hypothetical protein
LITIRAGKDWILSFKSMEITFNIYHVIICSLLASVITVFVHRWFLDQVQMHSDANVRLVKLLIVGAGDLYKNDILPEFGLILIRASEAIMNPTKIRYHVGFDYTLMMDELQDRIIYDHGITGRNYKKPSLNGLSQIDRSAYLMSRH